MGHILSTAHRNEFLNVPVCVRVTLPEAGGRIEPTLLLKADTLSLKYLVGDENPPRLMISPLGESGVVYGMELGPEDDALLVWSLLESQDEKEALLALLDQRSVVLFLFNELAVNVGWAEFRLGFRPMDARGFIESTTLQAFEGSYEAEVEASMKKFKVTTENALLLEPACEPLWSYAPSNYYGNTPGLVIATSLWDEDEGKQQENLATWITDGLLEGVPSVQSPQIPDGKGTRELTAIPFS